MAEIKQCLCISLFAYMHFELWTRPQKRKCLTPYWWKYRTTRHYMKWSCH